ncbi:hypothetical protein Tsubulata_033275 [Turnera subulata]|uniref:ER membrane protein complex subunit 2 n=1 Tax=Turnera subulata TaxID=218843 RepID=A0A9Q0EY11_9ROSI|nr:hypothetical protein Tsubulata_033275 [Turnera subulata]
MVTKTEETQLNRLESQVDNGGGGAWEYLCLVSKLKVRRSEKVLKHGLAILNDPKKRSALGPEEWTLYEQVAIAAMDCQNLDVAKDCVNVLQKKFPESKRVGRLEAMLLEAKGSWGEAEKAYSSLLEDNQFDQIIHKRRVALAKAQGNMYKQAAFCYEEVILSQPMVPLYHLAYADVLYTLGGLENLQTAKKYYSSTIELTGGKNTRALFVRVNMDCSSAIAQLSKGRNKEDKDSPDLQSLAVAALEKDYKYRASEKLTVLTSAFKNLKVSS